MFRPQENILYPQDTSEVPGTKVNVVFFLLSFILTASQCSYLVNGTSGQVDSPRAGSQELYFPNLNCQWTIQGNIGTRIQIKVK